MWQHEDCKGPNDRLDEAFWEEDKKKMPPGWLEEYGSEEDKQKELIKIKKINVVPPTDDCYNDELFTDLRHEHRCDK